MKSVALKKKLLEAERFLANGDVYKGLAAYRKLAKQRAQDPWLWMRFGALSLLYCDLEAADLAWRTITKIHPSNARLLVEIGHCCETNRFPDLAQKYFEQAAEVDTKAINPRISLGLLHEKAHRMDRAREAIQQCLQIDPKDEQARYCSAFLNFREDRIDIAESQLQDLILSNPRHEYVRYASRYLLAQILDRTYRFDDAMRHLSEAKAIVRKLPYSITLAKCHPSDEQPDEWLLKLRRLPKNMGNLVEKKFPERVRSKIPRYAFLGGHPRSGTTLIEEIIGAHPNVASLDEPDVGYFVKPITQRMSVSRLNVTRRRYMESLQMRVGDKREGKLILEKNPANTRMLPNLLGIVPEMRVIMALRDPRDVVLSIYFQNIPPNNVRFYSLENFAKAYGNMMDIWLLVREWEGFSWIETRYEDIVSNLESEGRRITNFLGLRWHKNQTTFFETARKRRLYAPTYHDVTKPIYSKSVGRWRDYEKYFEPILPILKPYCNAFGYA
jgi:Tfp pilus assembly protein PilF